MSKRVLDLVLASALLLAMLPVWLLVALLVRLSSPGPILFRQTRCGEGGLPFTFYKFRTMVLDAEARLHEVQHLNERQGPAFKAAHDPRVTPVGRWLRRSSLDELPQLLNVLRGEMSLVGPRPPLPAEVAKYTPYHWGRLAVRPGITGLWQVRGRELADFDAWVALDLEYIRRRSLRLDCWLLLCTIPAVLHHRGAA
jgi:lipopolysaccharide/colanic/teichoic acid biosynthesis glycosyltransferase